jgi:ribosomal protein S18 acetylase RimI-like enzyme
LEQWNRSSPHEPTVNAPRLRRLTESDWRVFAELRLQALTDTLGDHDAQHRQESTFTAAQWRRRLRAHAQFAVYVDDRPVGLIGAQREHVDSVYLYSLWLEPESRGHGLGRALLAAAVDWARTEGARTVTLRVQAANASALRVYEGLGFRPAEGENPTSTEELTMSLSVG